MERETSDIVIFFGRFHPLILHIPVGFLLLAFLLEIFSRFKRFEHYKPAVGFVLFLGAFSAAVAALLGYMLALSGGYDDDLLFVHQWSGIAVAILGFVSFALHRRLKQHQSLSLQRAYLMSLSMMVFTLAVAGHYGGSLTHGSDYLTQYMPDPLRRVAGLPGKEKKEARKITNLEEAVVYADIIDPIVENHCTSCHNKSKKKGDLMMHTYADLMKGGENGAALIPGKAQESDMIKRILLPEHHDDHMPPEGKSQLDAHEVALLSWWIDDGAPPDKKIAEVNVPQEIQAILDQLVDPNASKSQAEILLSSTVPPVDPGVLSQLQRKGVSVKTLADEVSWLQADMLPGVPADSMLGAFDTIQEQLTWLGLRNTSTTDEGLALIGKFKNLTKLDLGNTAVTNAGLRHLKDLPYLETLNLYGTEITDDAIESLAALKALKKLYVWKTRITPQGAARLVKRQPGLTVNTGLDNEQASRDETRADPSLAKY